MNNGCVCNNLQRYFSLYGRLVVTRPPRRAAACKLRVVDGIFCEN
jgi:hypothetical protein